MARHEQRHLGGCPAFLLIPILLPTSLVAALATRLGLLKGTADVNAEDVESYLKDFLRGGGGQWDWDDFTTIPITDPLLERIRKEALSVPLPLTAEGETTVRRLLEQVQAM